VVLDDKPDKVRTGKAKPSKIKRNALITAVAVAAAVLIFVFFNVRDNDRVGKETDQPSEQYHYIKKDGSPDWESFFSAVKTNAVNYKYIFVRKEKTDVSEKYALNSVGNIFYYHEGDINYQMILRNNDHRYSGKVHRFNGDQTGAAILYFKDQLPNHLQELLEWALFLML
jgi:hypothetical protein